jgi:LuxR family transcriptional activator of conjugal transfer of Ti plasmids
MLAYAGRASECADMGELASLAADSVGMVGMTAIASGMITGPRVARSDVFHFNNWPEAWTALYRGRGFMERDPLPRWAVVSGAPARWSDIVRQLPPNDPGREMLAEAARFGFVEGVLTPVRTMAGHLGLVSVGGGKTEVSAEEFHFLHTISTVTLHRAEAFEHGVVLPVAPNFSRREQECVILLSQGMTEREIADKLGIREVTARFHLDNARVKTGARSRTHLAAIAGQWLGRRTGPPG